MKSIGVLGGSYLQAEFARTAHLYGLTVFVFDANPKAYLKKDKEYSFVNLDFSQENELLTFCRVNSIEMLYAPSNEKGNLIASKLSSELGYYYNSYETVSLSLDKSQQRKSLSGLSKIKSPKSIICDQRSNPSALEEMGFPLIVKPADSSGSRGVIGVTSRDELTNAIEFAKGFSNSKVVLVEEQILGIQLSVETISCKGNHHIIGITKEVISPTPKFLERSHFIDRDIHNLFFDKLKAPVKELLDSMNVEVGPCHIELIINDEGIYLIEAATRAGGWRDRLILNAGIGNYNELILNAYLNKEIDLESISKPSNYSMLNIMMYDLDLSLVEKGKQHGVLQSVYFNGNSAKEDAQNLIDAYGYAYFKSKKPLGEYSLT